MNELERFELLPSDDTLSMVFITLANSIVSKLWVEQLQAVGPVVVDLDKEKTSLSNNSVICTTSREAASEKVATRKWRHSKSDVFGLRRRSRVEGEPATQRSFDIKEEYGLDDIVPAAFT